MRTPRLHTSTMLSCACNPNPSGGVTAEWAGRGRARQGEAARAGGGPVGLTTVCASGNVLLGTPPWITRPGGRWSVSVSGSAHLALDHLGRQVVKCSAECRAPRMRRVHRPTKVCNLELAPEIEQQVLWLDVAVDHVLGVAVVERAGQRLDVLPQQGRGGVKAGSSAIGRVWAAALAGLWHASRRALHLSRALLVKLPALLQLLVQLPFGRKLEDQVDARLVEEVAVQSEDVVVPAAAATGR